MEDTIAAISTAIGEAGIAIVRVSGAQALGYSRRMIGTIVLTEAGVYALGAVILSIPAAIATSLYLNNRMSAAWVQIDHSFLPSAFAGVLVPGLVLIPLGCLPALRHVLRRDALTRIRARTLE